MVTLDQIRQAQQRIRGRRRSHTADRLLSRIRCGGRARSAMVQAGEPAARRLVQAARRVQQNRFAHRRGARAWRDLLLQRQSCAGCCLRGARSRRQSRHRHAAQCAATQARSHRRSGRGDRHRRPRQHASACAKPKSLRPNTATSSCRPTTTSRSSPDKAPPALRFWKTVRRSSSCWCPTGGGGLISGVSSAMKLSGSKAKVDRRRARAGQRRATELPHRSDRRAAGRTRLQHPGRRPAYPIHRAHQLRAHSPICRRHHHRHRRRDSPGHAAHGDGRAHSSPSPAEP